MLVQITKPYGGQEGRRVKVGTVFAVDVVHEGLRTITRSRWLQLKQRGLAKEVEGNTPAAPAARSKVLAPARRAGPSPRRGPAAKVEPDSAPPPQAAPAARRRTRKRQEDTPGEPRPLSRRPGGPAGTEQPASSSPEDQVVGSVTLKQRGNRRRASGGSPSTTPVSPPPTPAAPTSAPASPPGPTSSTPATEPGGAPSTASPDSAAFD